ncbi:mycofactocin biosynthesis glycosyltransferase MftF [Phytoactinopolyspora mesophila]|uniref:mycofactocin biosynthesis glycosyltransferase MftF n=1 Tax=Phytoactinopolyspora mesophila TaxID=2650750 RepID=UPI001C9E7F24
MRLNRHTRVTDGGRVLYGGAPARVSRLRPAAASLIRERSFTITDAASRALAEYLIEAGLADPEPESLPPVSLTDVTVVIPAWRRPRQLERLLSSVRDHIGAVRVLVVDDCSGAESQRVADVAGRHSAELIGMKENRGPADARNAGLARVTTPFVLFVDTDAVLRPGAVELLLRHFADSRLAAVAPRVSGLTEPGANWILRYENARSSLDHGTYPSLVRPHSPMAWVSTTCLLARTSALGGGFGAGMRVAEDVDLVWRLVAEGWRVRYEPRAVIEHEHRGAPRAWLGRKFTYGTGAAALARRHPGLAAPAVLSPWTAAVLVTLAAQRRWSVPVAGAVTAVAASHISRRIGSTDDPHALAVRLTGHGLVAATAQGFALAVRHWWPAFALAAWGSSRARRMIAVAAVADAAWEYARLRPGLDPLRFAAARRLDDLAYGAGVWWGAWRARSAAALLPVVTRRRAR